MSVEQAHPSRSYRLTVAGLVLVLTVIVFANSWGIFTADIKPEVYLAPGAMVSDYLSAWTFSPYLGGPNFNAGLVPVVGFLSLFRGIGLSPELAFKAFHLLLWLVAASGMVRLLRRVDPSAAPVVGLLAGIAYIANPYAVSAGATLAILLPMALLPWQLLALLRALEAPRSWRWPAVFGLTFFLMSGMNAGVVPVLTLLAVIPVAVYGRKRWGLSRRTSLPCWPSARRSSCGCPCTGWCRRLLPCRPGSASWTTLRRPRPSPTFLPSPRCCGVLDCGRSTAPPEPTRGSPRWPCT